MRKHHCPLRALLPVLALIVSLNIFLPLASTSISSGVQAAPFALARAMTSTPPVVRYQIDASQSRFIVRASVGGLLSGFGHNHNIAIRGITGEVQFTPDALESASLEMRIRADSLAVLDKVNDKDRREIERKIREEVLETTKYPEIIFRSTNVSANKTAEGQYHLKIWGNLTLHGVTHHGLIQAQLTLTGDRLQARGEFPLRQTDYNITPPSVAAGTIKVKDELKFSFDIVSHQ